MTDTIAKLCYPVKQHIAMILRQALTMKNVNARQILAVNLRDLMGEAKELSTQKKIEAASGVPQSLISQLLRPNNCTARNPKLDTIERVCRAFGLEVWQFLHPDCLALFMAKRGQSTQEKKAHTAAPHAAKHKEIA